MTYEPLPAEVDWHDRTILIVEDVLPNFVFLQSALQKTQAKIVHSPNGNDAVKKCLEDKNIDLVLMDLHLPGMDGLAATREIKRQRPDLIVIAHTAFVLSGERKKSQEAGCDDYIAKPIRSNELIFKIRNCYIKAGKEA